MIMTPFSYHNRSNQSKGPAIIEQLQRVISIETTTFQAVVKETHRNNMINTYQNVRDTKHEKGERKD